MVYVGEGGGILCWVSFVFYVLMPQIFGLWFHCWGELFLVGFFIG